MTYQETLDGLAEMSEVERQSKITAHWQVVFSDGFIGFVQGQVEAGRAAVQPGSQAMQLLAAAGLPDDVMMVYFEQQLQKAVGVWESMRAVYSMLQQRSERQGSAGGMVNHGPHTSMPAGVSVAPAVNCYRCGSPVSSNGLCSGCLATQEEWDQQDVEYDQRLHDQQRDQLDYQRQQDDQQHYDTQLDFNTYEDY